ncbi:MAG TPA: hypothetical protein VKJ45_26570, partial [Blastocatellia bacterium]|nr:hypothetical protein [Blastocatellia bacterium]
GSQPGTAAEHPHATAGADDSSEVMILFRQISFGGGNPAELWENNSFRASAKRWQAGRNLDRGRRHRLKRRTCSVASAAW